MDHKDFFDGLALDDSQFDHPSDLHGIGHTYRVMVHVYMLTQSVCRHDLLLPALSAAFVHDMARRHDGYCDQHGRWAAEKKLPVYRSLFLQNGVTESGLMTIATAIENHCCRKELEVYHPDHAIVSLLKDADALDRIRLGEGNLNKNYLRFPESLQMVDFAKDLYFSTRNLNFYNFTGILQHAILINQKKPIW